MRLPDFTAEASLASAKGDYTGCSAAGKNIGGSSVVAEFDFKSLPPSYWGNLGNRCPPPFCNRDANGRCHCRTVSYPG